MTLRDILKNGKISKNLLLKILKKKKVISRKNKKIENKKSGLINWLIRLSSLLLGLVCIVISIYLTSKWFIYIGFIFIGIPLSVTYIIFINIVFEFGIKFILLKKFRGYFIIFLWLILVSYSMITTIAGQYNKLVSAENQRIENDYDFSNQIIIDDLKEEIKDLKNQKLELKTEITSLIEKSNSVNNIEDSYKYKNTIRVNNKRIDKIRKLLKEINKTIENKTIEYHNLIKENKKLSLNEDTFKIDSGSVYNYFSKITKINPLIIQFILSLFPGLFVDIISPISIALFLFSKDIRNLEKTKK